MRDRVDSGQYASWFNSLWPSFVLAAFSFIFINPFREAAIDDDWGYALTVRHLLQTGSFRLHDWQTANMPFQAYWGALFTHLGNGFFTDLRLSTLVLLGMASIAFFLLCLEHGCDRRTAGLLLLGLLSCPIIPRLAFSFMTDIPYLSCLVIAVYLYTVGLRLTSSRIMFAASLAATAAVLTRQFGCLLVGAVVLLWLVSKDLRDRWFQCAVGIFVPTIATIWQVYEGLAAPTWAMRSNLIDLKAGFSEWTAVLGLTLWRPLLAMEYAAFFCLPFAVLPLIAIWRKSHSLGSFEGRRLLSVSMFVVAWILILHFSPWHYPWLMPLIPWNFAVLTSLGPVPQVLLTIPTVLGTGVVAEALTSRWRSEWSTLPVHQRLLDVVILGCMLTTLLYGFVGDEYLLPFAPFVLIILGRRWAPILKRHAALLTAACLLIGLVTAVQTRRVMAREEVLWRGGEIARSLAGPDATISASWMWTSFYHFSDFRKERPNDTESLDYFKWLLEFESKADYVVGFGPPKSGQWLIAKTIPYQPFPFIQRSAYLFKRAQ